MKKHGLLYHIIFFPFLLFKYGFMLGEVCLKVSMTLAFKFALIMPKFLFFIITATLKTVSPGFHYSSSCSGYQYENICAKILKNDGFSCVSVTSKSCDQGIDIIAHKNGKKYGIQCKYYSSPVGNKAVQEAFTGARYYDCDVAAVMTNTTFTASAKDLAQKTGVLLWSNYEAKAPVPTYIRLTKAMGIFMVVLGLTSMLLPFSGIQVPYSSLQLTIGIFIFAGGVLNILQCKKVYAGRFASACYLITFILESILDLLLNGTFNIGSLLFLLFALISFFIYRKSMNVNTIVKPHCNIEQFSGFIQRIYREIQKIFSGRKSCDEKNIVLNQNSLQNEMQQELEEKEAARQAEDHEEVLHHIIMSEKPAQEIDSVAFSESTYKAPKPKTNSPMHGSSSVSAKELKKHYDINQLLKEYELKQQEKQRAMEQAQQQAEKERQEVLLYAAMCEKHAQEQDFMEKLGINPDDYK